MLSFLFWSAVYILTGLFPAIWVGRASYASMPNDIPGTAVPMGMAILLGPFSLALWLIYMVVTSAMPFLIPQYGLALAEKRAEAREATERDQRRLADRLHKELGLDPINWKDAS